MQRVSCSYKTALFLLAFFGYSLKIVLAIFKPFLYSFASYDF